MQAAPVRVETSAPASSRPWALIAVALLFLVAFGPVLLGIGGSWFDPFANMEHGVIVPFIVAYVVFEKRDALMSVPRQPCNWALAVLVWFALQVWISMVAHWVWLTRISVLGSLAGAILYLYSYRLLKELSYAFLLMFMAITPPSFLYARFTYGLQMVASQIAEKTLELFGFSVLREGNILEMVGERLAVEEACSGIRSLVTLAFFALVYVYFLVPDKKLRWILSALVAPIAIAGNALRIVITGVVAQYDREFAHSSFHELSGYVILIFGGVAFITSHYILNLYQRKTAVAR